MGAAAAIRGAGVLPGPIQRLVRLLNLDRARKPRGSSAHRWHAAEIVPKQSRREAWIAALGFCLSVQSGSGKPCQVEGSRWCPVGERDPSQRAVAGEVSLAAR